MELEIVAGSSLQALNIPAENEKGLFLGSKGMSWSKKDLNGSTKPCPAPVAQQSVSPVLLKRTSF